MEFSGEPVPELGLRFTDLLLDSSFRRSERLCGQLLSPLKNARPQVLVQALPQLLFHFRRNLPERHLKPVAPGIARELLPQLADLRLERLNKFGQHGSQTVFGELIFDLVENGLRRRGASLRLVDGPRARRTVSRGELSRERRQLPHSPV